MITQERLKELLDYNPETGVFTWKIDGNNQYVKKGMEAGTLYNNDYIMIMVEGERQGAHRWAFLYMEGYIPEFVDHIDRNPQNNRWKNLRSASKPQNCRNKKHKKSKSGYANVMWAKDRQKWRVQITDETGRKRMKGTFNYEDLALAVDLANKSRQEIAGEYALIEEFLGYIPDLEELNK